MVVLTVVGYLPWLSTFLQQFGKTSKSWWLATFDANSVLSYITFLFEGRFATFYLTILGVIAAGGALLCWERRKATNRNTDLYFAFISISIILLTIGVGCVASKLIRPLFLSRYMYPATGLFFLGISICAANIEYRKLACCTIIAITLVSFPFSYKSVYYAEYKTGTEGFKRFAAEHFDGAEVSTDMTHLSWTLLPYYVPHHAIHNKISHSTRGYVITSKQTADLQKIIPSAEIKQVFSGDIDNRYKFFIYYVQ